MNTIPYHSSLLHFMLYKLKKAMGHAGTYHDFSDLFLFYRA